MHLRLEIAEGERPNFAWSFPEDSVILGDWRSAMRGRQLAQLVGVREDGLDDSPRGGLVQ